jgi:putative copper export protein/mono/diheme cytochrome c family protein
VTLAVAVLVRWLALGALVGLIGGLALEVFVLPAGETENESSRRRLRVWRFLCISALLLTTAADILMRARTMGGAGLAQSVRIVPLVLSRTHFGAIWLGRVVALGALLLVATRRGDRARVVALALAAIVALSTALSGHAADWGDVSATVLIDWGHVLAASLWIGGVVTLALVIFRMEPALVPASVTRVCARFSRLAGWSLAAVVLTGLYNAWIQLPDVAALRDTPYGRVLLGKLALVGILVALGGRNRYTLLPRLTGVPARGPVARCVRRCRLALFGPARVSSSRLVTVVACEAVLGIAVLGLTAVLGESTPARHAGHVTHVADVDAAREPIRATIEQLHEAGGVPRGWTFRLPSGDARRGREVFARLECYRCHRVRGESYPAPSAAGPELTGIGGHHPAGYIAESILNPNAVIVEGPGYTGPDGRSTMPEYRNVLSVADLLDLVAYLEAQGGVHRHRP